MEPGIGSLVNDKIIHERARLLILTYLASSDVKAVPFSETQGCTRFYSRKPVDTIEDPGGSGLYFHNQGVQGQ